MKKKIEEKAIELLEMESNKQLEIISSTTNIDQLESMIEEMVQGSPAQKALLARLDYLCLEELETLSTFTEVYDLFYFTPFGSNSEKTILSKCFRLAETEDQFWLIYDETVYDETKVGVEFRDKVFLKIINLNSDIEFLKNLADDMEDLSDASRKALVNRVDNLCLEKIETVSDFEEAQTIYLSTSDCSEAESVTLARTANLASSVEQIKSVFDESYEEGPLRNQILLRWAGIASSIEEIREVYFRSEEGSVVRKICIKKAEKLLQSN